MSLCFFDNTMLGYSILYDSMSDFYTYMYIFGLFAYYIYIHPVIGSSVGFRSGE